MTIGFRHNRAFPPSPDTPGAGGRTSETTKTSGLHLAIIPDGNRRWARRHKLEAAWKGHEKAIENFRTLADWCRLDPRVSILTVWCFSTENWKRDPEEVAMLMTKLEEYLRNEKHGLKENKTRFLHSGCRDRIPASLKKILEETEEETRNETGFTLHLAVDYGGKDEILRAINRYISQPETSNQPFEALMGPQAQNGKLETPQHLLEDDTLRSFLDHPDLPDIDLILRSSGEQRTSNFFLWQSVYSEWVFSPKYFPDIGTADLDEALKEYERRKRRYGE